jgi:hypothetical protein
MLRVSGRHLEVPRGISRWQQSVARARRSGVRADLYGQHVIILHYDFDVALLINGAVSLETIECL